MPPQQEREAIEHLKKINEQLTKQNSFSHMFLVGIIYGVGFFLGSVVLATIAFEVVAPFFAGTWIGNLFWNGLSSLHH